MMQASLLMDSRGKPSDSFVVLDLMRFPLGILSGIGFIGAGAILRRGDIVRGVTTAATLWFVTVIGLCLGGGQLVLGMASTLLALAVLAGVKRFEGRLPTQHRGRMQISTMSGGPSESVIRQRLSEEAFHVRSAAIRVVPREDRVEFELEIYWKAPHEELRRPALLEHLRNDPQVLQFSWRPQV
jgi:putative Mg2+ transporter-C (MgtC) family protein